MIFFLYLLRLIAKYMKMLFSKENMLTIYSISIEVENFHSIINPPKKQPKKDALDLSIQSFSSLNSLENCKDIDTKHDKK